MVQDQWKALEHMYTSKKSRAIGVSNYCVECLRCIKQALAAAEARSNHGGRVAEVRWCGCHCHGGGRRRVASPPAPVQWRAPRRCRR